MQSCRGREKRIKRKILPSNKNGGIFLRRKGFFRDTDGKRKKKKTERERLVRIFCVREGKRGLQINNFAL